MARVASASPGEAGPRPSQSAETAARPTVRITVTVLCLVVVGVLFGGVARQVWTSTGAAADVVELEAYGAELMHPMTTLLGELVTAQSAAVRGDAVNQASVRDALRAVDEQNSRYDGALATDQRLLDLNSQVETAFENPQTGRPAYETYSTIVDLTLDLIRVIGDSSHLFHDPELDAFYLMDAALNRLPHAMVYAGRASDLVALADGGVLSGEDEVRAAVARFGVSSDAEQVSAGLTTSVDFTARSQLGTNIAQRLDAFRSAADAFAPPTMLQELANAIDEATMAENASRVFAAAVSLSHLLLSELQALLDVRTGVLAQQYRFTVIASVAAGVVGIVVLWLVVTMSGPHRRPRYGSPPADRGDRSADGTGLRDRDLVTAGRPAPSLASFAARELPGESPGPVRPSRSSLAARELPGDAR